MSRNEAQTCRELIEPALAQAGWEFDSQVQIGPGRVNITGERMYDETQRIVADYVLRLWSMPLAILEAKAESYAPSEGIQQAQRYANRLGMRFSIASNGHQYILVDGDDGSFETYNQVPTPGDVLHYLGRNIVWEEWRPVFQAPWYVDQVTRKTVRPYQEMAIFEVLYAFSQGKRRALVLMATGTGKTFTVFQLVWKLLNGGILPNNRVLFLTDRNSLKGQAYRAFAGFSKDDRVVIDTDTVRNHNHLVGKVFFANYQNLDEELDGKKVYEHFPADFFDLVVIDECHRSGFGDWFGVLEYFSSAFQLGLTATPRELELAESDDEETKRRDTHVYFGPPIYTYTLKQAIEDGYLVPYLLEQRVTNLDEDGYELNGRVYRTPHFERDIRLPDRTRAIAEDLYAALSRHGLEEEKTIVFCVDDTHAAFMAQELRRVAGDDQYAARITRGERNSHQLERNFAEVGRSKPRVAVTVDLLTTGFDAPDVRNIVFARPLQSAILYKQMKGRGTRLCQDIDKRYFTIFDYSFASNLEDAEFDGHPANVQKPKRPTKGTGAGTGAGGTGGTGGAGGTTGPGGRQVPVVEGVTVTVRDGEQFVCFADGRRIPFNDYRQQSRDCIRGLSIAQPQDLLKLWIDRKTRNELRAELQEKDIHVPALRFFLRLEDTDDVDVLDKVAFDHSRVPRRRDRVDRFWNQDEAWLLAHIAEASLPADQLVRQPFWEACLDHYSLFGVDDLERGETYSAPQFVERFGSFVSFANRYGGPQRIRADLEAVKQHLYVPMAA
ncbi:MAG: DEAD/DEAH box helicase family protein [Alphaproteobacteria bacterium]|nr:DEAD/DEAH box helicase family protein [Alphaproteobacteria bacterium]